MSTPRSRTPLVIGIVVAVVAVAAILAVVLSSGSDEVEVAPPVAGVDFAGDAVELTPGTDGPMMVVFLAHWCPHCNAEIPVLLEWEAAGEIPADLSVVGVSTAVRPDAPNYPPGEWLDAMGWEWPAIDDTEGTLAQAFGVDGYPYMVFIDAAGEVTATTSGEQPVERLQELADEATATAA